jgi:hypothetical protein
LGQRVIERRIQLLLERENETEMEEERKRRWAGEGGVEDGGWAGGR